MEKEQYRSGIWTFFSAAKPRSEIEKRLDDISLDQC